MDREGLLFETCRSRYSNTQPEKQLASVRVAMVRALIQEKDATLQIMSCKSQLTFNPSRRLVSRLGVVLGLVFVITFQLALALTTALAMLASFIIIIILQRPLFLSCPLPWAKAKRQKYKYIVRFDFGHVHNYTLVFFLAVRGHPSCGMYSGNYILFFISVKGRSNQSVFMLRKYCFLSKLLLLLIH